MSINFQKFCEDNNIPYATEGHKHCRPGWVQVECPICTGNPGMHLGYQISKDRFHCWRCGAKSAVQVIKGLLKCSDHEALHALFQYKGRPVLLNGKEEEVRHSDSVKLPFGSGPLQEIHKAYLRQRDFSPNKVTRAWGLKGTGPIGTYRFRIIAPIYFKGELISYQGRDVTEKSKLRYMACKKEDEVMDHKHVLYGIDQIKGDMAVVVEGITKVWRLGIGSVATFGTAFKMEQAYILAHRFKRLHILFDSEITAQKEANKLANIISPFVDEVQVVELGNVKDPGDLEQDDADELMQVLGFQTDSHDVL